MKKLLISLLLVSGQASFAWIIQKGDLNAWLGKISMSPGAQAQLAAFFNQDPAASAAYGDKLLATYKGELGRGLQFVTNESQCRQHFSVGFNKQLTGSNGQGERNFEGELLRLESVDCLPNLDLQRVVTTYLSDSFQLKYINGLKFSQSDEKNNWVCQRTSVFPLGNSDYCGRFHLWQNDHTVVVFSLNEVNNNNPKAFVYFRAVTTVFRKMADGNVLVYNLTYGRGPNLPFHSIVEDKVEKQHGPFIQALIQESQ